MSYYLIARAAAVQGATDDGVSFLAAYAERAITRYPSSKRSSVSYGMSSNG
jgi:hypothetical protein